MCNKGEGEGVVPFSPSVCASVLRIVLDRKGVDLAVGGKVDGCRRRSR